jgi:hypothetical protein
LTETIQRSPVFGVPVSSLDHAVVAPPRVSGVIEKSAKKALPVETIVKAVPDASRIVS